MLGNLGNMASLLKNAPEMMRQAAEMQERMKATQDELAKLRVEGVSGGGMVRVEANGQQKILAVHLEESLTQTGDREMIEELVLTATNQALDKARQMASEEMSKVAGGMDIPGLNDALSKMGLGDPPQ